MHTSSKRTHRGPLGRLRWQRPQLHLPLILLLSGSIAPPISTPLIIQKDADLAVLDLAGGAAVLHLHTGRVLPALWEARLVNGDDGPTSAELLQDVGAQVVAHALGVPDRLGKQALHPVGRGFAGLFCQLPAVFALDGAQQALQVLQRPLTWFRAGKTRDEATMQVNEFVGPGRHVSRGRLEAGTGDMLGWLHDLLLSGVSDVEICTTSMSHLSGQGVKRVFGGRKRTTVQFRKRNCSVDAFSCSLYRCFPWTNRLHVLDLQCAAGFISTQRTISVFSLHLRTPHREDVRKNRSAWGDTNICMLSCC